MFANEDEGFQELCDRLLAYSSTKQSITMSESKKTTKKDDPMDVHALLQAASCKLQAASCKLQAASCKLQAASCNLQAASCKLQAASCKLQAVSCKLQAASCKLLYL